jgi:hypothetical protein
MPKPLLSKAETDALMGLFDTRKPAKTDADFRKKGGDADDDVAALKRVLESEALRWSEALASLTGHPAKVSLRTIVRVSGISAGAGEVCFRFAQAQGHFLICSEALVNLVNEKSLGAGEEPPMVTHPLSAIDRTLFEGCGAFFAREGELVFSENLPEEASRIEARYDIEIAPLLRTAVRLVIDEHDGQFL